MKKIITTACLAFLLWSPLQAQTPAPQLIPFQARLTDQAGQAHNNGNYSITFNLYSNALGGSTLWTERHENVSIINGTVNVFLGSINPLSTLDFSTTKHLGVTVDADNNAATADPEMVPRQMIIPAFHSKKADDAVKLAGFSWSSILTGGSNNPATGTIRGDKLEPASVNSAQIAPGAVGSSAITDGSVGVADLSPEAFSSFTPPGTVVAFAGPNAPAGWMLCDGSALKSTDHPKLFAAIGTAWGAGAASGLGAVAAAIPGMTNFNIPDMRGLFLRGANGNAGADPGGYDRLASFAGGNTGDKVGTKQWDEFKSHNHTFRDAYFSENYGLNQGKKGALGSDNDNAIQEYDDTTEANGGAETRPRNVAVNYIIKL